MLKILSWNIMQGGGSRTNQIIQSLIDYKAEVVVLSEYHNNEKGAYIRYQLNKAGYHHQIVGDAKPKVNSVAILSKYKFDGIHCTAADPTYKDNIVLASFEAFDLYGMYLPHKKKHILFDYLLDQTKGKDNCILVGDFNSGINYVDQKGNSFHYEDELIKLKEQGFVDAFREINGDQKEYSWYSHAGNGFRYDHSYVGSALKPLIKDCFYLQDWRINKYSDHAPMVLEL